MVVASGFDILAAALAMAVILEVDRRQSAKHASIDPTLAKAEAHG